MTPAIRSLYLVRRAAHSMELETFKDYTNTGPWEDRNAKYESKHDIRQRD
jgi:hypothetical protein